MTRTRKTTTAPASVFAVYRDLGQTENFRPGLVHYTINGQPVERPEFERRLAAARDEEVAKRGGRDAETVAAMARRLARGSGVKA